MFSTWIGVVLLFGFFGLLVWSSLAPAREATPTKQNAPNARAEKLKTLREEANKALTTYGWVDKAKGVARIPIDRAMKLTLADLVAKKPAPANPIATPEPQASAAPAVSPAGTPPPAARKNTMSTAEQTKQFLARRDSVEPKNSLGLLARIRRYQRNAEIIFDAEEPIGAPTDLVMPYRRWFRRNKIRLMILPHTLHP